MKGPVAIVLPVFNDTPSLGALAEQIVGVLGERRTDVSFLIVDDGSWPPISAAVRQRLEPIASGQIIALHRNVGHQRAIAVGLAYAVESGAFETIVVMDADGEDRPSDLRRLLDASALPEAPTIVVAARTKRSEGFRFRVFYLAYRLMFQLLTGRTIVFGNFMALPVVAARRLVNMSELWLSVPAAVLKSHLPISMLPTERGSRLYGATRMNTVSLVVHGLRAIAVFVEAVLTRIILGASALLALCLLASSVALVHKLIGIATPGWVTTVLGIFLVTLTGTLILCFVAIAISLTGGVQSMPAPSASYRVLIDRIMAFGPAAEAPPSPRAAELRRAEGAAGGTASD